MVERAIAVGEQDVEKYDNNGQYEKPWKAAQRRAGSRRKAVRRLRKECQRGSMQPQSAQTEKEEDGGASGEMQSVSFRHAQPGVAQPKKQRIADQMGDAERGVRACHRTSSVLASVVA